jgi:hypothetical protein
MGTLGKDGSNPLIFDGRPESWPPFKKALHQLLDKEGYGWVVEGGDVFCAMLQAASAKAAKSTVTSGKGTVSTNVADYQKKDLQTALTNASVTTSVLLELIANRKTVLGAHHADHEKMGMTEEELAQAHAVLDAQRLTMVNRTVVRWLHDAVYPNASETPATLKLRSILKTPEVTKILQGEKLTTESLWAAQPWQIPAVHIYSRLAYNFEGMTDMINGAFMEDLSELLNSATGDQRHRKSFYEMDTEFEKMMASLLKNFNSMASLMPFLRASLRQTMIRKLASVGKGKDGWKKADEHLTTLMDQEHMITLEDTEAALKRCEQHLQRAATDDASPKAKVLATEISGQDTAAELAARKATTKAQDAKMKVLSAQLRGDTSGAKRARNGVPVEKKPIPVCTVCSKRGHNAVDCWDKLDADQVKLELARRLATRRRRTCPSASRLAKQQRLTPPLLLLIKPWRPLRLPRTRTTPRVMRLYTAACLIKSSCLIRPALYLIAARKSTSLKEPSDPAPAFSLPVSQALQPRLKEQMPCSPYSPQMDRATLFQFVARISSPHARQTTSCLLPSCSRQDTKSNFALARTLTTLVATCTRQRVSALLSFSQAISGGFQCGAHPHDVRVLPVSLLIRIHSLRF